MSGQARRSIRIHLTADESADLERHRRRHAHVRPARLRFDIILACADSHETLAAVADHVGCDASTVSKWRRAYLQDGIDRLVDTGESGSGRISDAVVEDSVREALRSDPFREECLSTRAAAQRIGVSHTTIAEIWRAFGVTPWLTTAAFDSVECLTQAGGEMVAIRLEPPSVCAAFVDADSPSESRVGRGDLDLDLDLDRSRAPIDFREDEEPTSTEDDVLAFLERVDDEHQGVEVRVLMTDVSAHLTRPVQKWLLAHSHIEVQLFPAAKWRALVDLQTTEMVVS
ncbi:MAG: helix-turn-helix domain-containing protein [Acidimicrobiales bacterium]|nr:helix-turn-helix domain-containing protein [Acidimicrobiales bacterium]